MFARTRVSQSNNKIKEGVMLQTVVKTTDHVSQEQRVAQIQPLYLNTVTLVECLHRRLLDVIKDEFDRRSRAEINSIQAFLLYNIGDQEITAGAHARVLSGVERFL
jgi:hypothetical protein